MIEKYPYFAYDALMKLRSEQNQDRRDHLRRIVAANIGDPIVLAEILGLNTESLADLYPDSLLPHLSTLDTIDTFLSTYGNQSPYPASDLDCAPNEMRRDEMKRDEMRRDEMKRDEMSIPSDPYIPESDSVRVETSNDDTFSAIDAFLKAVPPPQPKRPKPIAVEEESPALTEQFAKILIKNQNYTKALQIIQELNLKNPEKSVYFADQIRFLKKLIINQQKRNR